MDSVSSTAVSAKSVVTGDGNGAGGSSLLDSVPDKLLSCSNTDLTIPLPVRSKLCFVNQLLLEASKYLLLCALNVLFDRSWSQ